MHPFHQIVRLCAAVAIALAAMQATAVAEDWPRESSPRLHLVNGDLMSGKVVASDEAGVLRWQSTFATEPFDFPTTGVNVAHFPLAADPPEEVEAFTIHTVEGEMLHGSLAALDAAGLHVESRQLGRLELATAHLRRIVRTGEGNRLIYVGPDGLVGWKSKEDKGTWREEVGHLLTAGSLAELSQPLPVSKRANIEFAISWHTAAEFSVEIGKLFHLEIWKDKLVLVRETDEAADIQVVARIDPGAGQMHLQIFLDQEAGLVSVHTLAGEKLAAIELDAAVEERPVAKLTNFSGDFRLEHLAIREWDGRLPTAVDLAGPFVERVDRTLIEGDSIALDGDSGEIVVTSGADSHRIRLVDVFSMHFAGQAAEPESDVRVSLHDSTRLVGRLQRVDGGALYLQSPSIATPVPVPLAEIRSLVSLRKQQPSHNYGSQLGRLETDGVRSHGKLIDFSREDGRGGLIWQPVGSPTAATLQPRLAARIVYVDRTAASGQSDQSPRAQPAQQVQVDGFIGGVFRALNFGQRGESQAREVRRPRSVSSASSGDVLVLRAGDRLPCEVVEVGESNIRFESEFVAATQLPIDRVKAWERTPESSLNKLDETKRRRLLTLPRVQRNNPPSHLIESTSGDFVRGRLVSADEQHLFVELRLDTKKIPRERVRRVVWLDQAEEDQTDEEVGAADDAQQVAEKSELKTDRLVQAVHFNGVRLSFVPEQVADGVLSGTSDVLGPCSVKLSSVNELRLGAAIMESASEVVSRDWQLLPARDPRYVAEEDGAAGSGGADSPLVGSPAPDFKLELLDGSEFQLSKAQGAVIVLDFWATWCGPCVHAMPIIDRVASEFADQDVRLIAVNMQEDRQSIEALLDRLELAPEVALDIDGATAEKYGVTAIPQTVIIDRQGNVARLFIGGGGAFEDQLRGALQQVVAGAAD